MTAILQGRVALATGAARARGLGAAKLAFMSEEAPTSVLTRAEFEMTKSPRVVDSEALRCVLYNTLAEGMGFEPMDTLPHQRCSRPSLSSAQATFRHGC